MTGAPPPLEAGCLPCQLDPEQWFDRRHHADALADCRRCPARRWCAVEALQCRASWGLWAGVWIDGRHEDAAPYLQAVATGALAQSSAVAAAVIDMREGIGPTGDPGRAPAPLRRPDGSSRASSARTAVLARSCGHCEVLAEGCGYTYDRLVSRRSAVLAGEISTPPTLFAACNSCAGIVSALDPKLASQFGYVIDGRRDPTHVPFYWRQSRWVLLDCDGWLIEVTDDAQTA
jgi:hypothetical protein